MLYNCASQNVTCTQVYCAGLNKRNTQNLSRKSLHTFCNIFKFQLIIFFEKEKQKNAIKILLILKNTPVQSWDLNHNNCPYMLDHFHSLLRCDKASRLSAGARGRDPMAKSFLYVSNEGLWVRRSELYSSGPTVWHNGRL